MSLVRTLGRSSDTSGQLTSLVWESQDLGMFQVLVAPAGATSSHAISTHGFSHFQAWVTTEQAGTVGVEIAAYHPVSRLAPTVNCVLGNLVFGAAGRGTLYFGIALDPPASTQGDKYRFSRLVRVTLRNNGVANVRVTLDLEMMG